MWDLVGKPEDRFSCDAAKKIYAEPRDAKVTLRADLSM